MFDNWRNKVTSAENFAHKIALQNFTYENHELIHDLIAKYSKITSQIEVTRINEINPQIVHPVKYFEGGAYNELYLGLNSSTNEFELTSTKSSHYCHIGNIYNYKTGIINSRHSLEQKMFKRMMLLNESIASHHLFIEWSLQNNGDITVTIKKAY